MIEAHERNTTGKETPTLSGHLVGSLDTRWAQFCKEQRRCDKKFSEKAVHDMRVATRRLISLVDIWMKIIADDVLKESRRELKSLLDEFGPLRDTQVQVMAIEKMRVSYRAVDSLSTVLKLREKQRIKTVTRRIRKLHLTKVKRNIAAIRSRLLTMFDDPTVEGAAHAAVVGAAAAAFAKCAELYSRIDPMNSSTIHMLRVAFKKFRYMAEALQPILPWTTDDLLKAMHDFQNRMGDIQDIEVLMAEVNTFASRSRAGVDNPVLPVQQDLARRRAALIDTFMVSSDQLFAFWQPYSLPLIPPPTLRVVHHRS